jgi:hypothetical protein
MLKMKGGICMKKYYYIHVASTGKKYEELNFQQLANVKSHQKKVYLEALKKDPSTPFEDYAVSYEDPMIEKRHIVWYPNGFYSAKSNTEVCAGNDYDYYLGELEAMENEIKRQEGRWSDICYNF